MIARLLTSIEARILAAIAVAAIAAAAVQTARIDGLPLVGGGLIVRAEQAERRAQAQFDAHVHTIRSYRNAQAEAARQEAARNARVAAEQKRINDDASQDFARRVGDLRVRYQQLRQAAGAGARGAADRVAVPAGLAAAGRADAAPGGEGFPLELRLIASEQAEQLDALITAIERQAAIDPNTTVAP